MRFRGPYVNRRGGVLYCPHCGREFFKAALVKGYCPRYWREKAPSGEEGATVSGEQGSLFTSSSSKKRAKTPGSSRKV